MGYGCRGVVDKGLRVFWYWRFLFVDICTYWENAVHLRHVFYVYRDKENYPAISLRFDWRHTADEGKLGTVEVLVSYKREI